MAFTDEFQKDLQKQTQWRAFLRKSKPENVPEDIDSVIGDVAAFLMPVMEAAQEEKRFGLFWPKEGPWKRSTE